MYIEQGAIDQQMAADREPQRRDPTITDLPDIVDNLHGNDRRAWNLMFRVTKDIARMRANGIENFRKLEEQTIITVTNLRTHRQAVYNKARAERPMEKGSFNDYRAEKVEKTRGKDPLCNPYETTPLDEFDDGGTHAGRVVGEHWMTGSNMAKAAPVHGLIICDEHDPFVIPTRDVTLDGLDVEDHYIQAAVRVNPALLFATIIHNNSPKAGGSLMHTHDQVLIGSSQHIGIMEEMHSVADFFHFATEGGSFLPDYIAAHNAVGLGLVKDGVTILPLLTPPKEYGLMLIVDDFGSQDAREVFYEALRFYRTSAVHTEKGPTGSLAYNSMIARTPITPEGRFRQYIPTVIGFVDRGDPTSPTADHAAAEQHGTVILGYDPFGFNRRLKQHFNAS